jgi:ribosome biogenesis GTPase
VELKVLGWNQDIKQFFNNQQRNDLIVGRVCFHSKKIYKVLTKDKEIIASLSGSYIKSIYEKSDFPAIGDWVGLKKIEGLQKYQILTQYPRRNKLSRKNPGGKTEEQVIAANIDIVFIVTSADQDFNLRRLERYLTLVYDINAKPVIILNKIDTNPDFQLIKRQLSQRFKHTQILSISAQKGTNINFVEELIKPGVSIVLIGSSGVGKSTLINNLLGYPRQITAEIRKIDGKGRHITTTRELIVLPDGGILIDTPGLREIQLWSSSKGVSKTFEKIEKISSHCRFDDCTHDHEPDCAVKSAVLHGDLSADELHNYQKLQKEQQYLERKKNIFTHRKRDRQLGKMYRQGKNLRKSRGKD